MELLNHLPIKIETRDDVYGLLEDLEDGEITFYTQGNFTDLCKGPHIPNTGKIKAVPLNNGLLSISLYNKSA